MFSEIEAALKKGWKNLDVKKISLHASKGATVKLDGSPIVEAKKGTYIKSIKLSDKTANKEFNKILKPMVKATKKNTEKVSANGISSGKTEITPLVISVYPSYAGNDSEAVKLAKSLGLTITTIDTSKVKYKNGVPKKLKGTIDNGKKVTLKQTKKEGKYKGYGEVKTSTVSGNSKSSNYVICDGNFGGNFYFTGTTSTK